MKYINVCKKFGKAATLAAVTMMPMAAMAADIDPQLLVGPITDSKPIIIAVAGAIFGLVGLLVAISYAKRAAR